MGSMLSLASVNEGAPRARRAEKLSVVEQFRKAAQRGNRSAMICGAILGAFVPVASYVLAHGAGEVVLHPSLWALVAGALVFSARSVYDFAMAAFHGSKAKSVGFVVLLEGTLVWAHTPALGWAALVLLAGINAVATGINLALDHKAMLADNRAARPGKPLRAQRR